LIGGVAPSFDNLIVDEEELKRRLGITVHHFEFNELLDMIRSVDDEHARVAAAEIRATAASFDETMGKALDISGRTDLAITRLAEENSLDACAISCWPRFQADLQFAVCTVMGHLNSHGLIASCEGDVTSAVSMLMLHSMTNGGTVTLMDLVTIDPADDSILLWHCGPTSPLLADERGARLESLWLFDGPQNNRVGLHNDLVLKPGKASVMGFSTDFQSMLILGGKIDNQKPGYSGSRGWLRDLQLNGTPVGTTDLVQTLMVSGYQHHYPLVYPDITAVGLETCQWLGVEPIAIEPYTPYVK
jgi:hypothetical protein